MKPTKLGYILSLDEFKNYEPDKKEKFKNLIVAESNLIEGIDSNNIKTRIIKEEESEEDFMAREFPEVTNHKKALDYVIINFESKVLSQRDILFLHKTLGENLISEAGTYRRHKCYIKWLCEDYENYSGKPHFRQIPNLMQNLEKDINNLEKKEFTLEKILNVHHKFETIHPFSDGNGRVGRLILNWLTLRHNKEFYVIEAKKRKEYYDEIKIYEKKFKKAHPEIKFYKDRRISRSDIFFRELEAINGSLE